MLGKCTIADNQARLVTHDPTYSAHGLFYKDNTCHIPKVILGKWHLDWTNLTQNKHKFIITDWPSSNRDTSEVVLAR